MRFLWRSLSVRGSAFLLALLAIVVGSTVTSAMLTMRADLGAKMSRELRRYGPNLLVRPEATPAGADAATPTLDERTVAAAENALRVRMPESNPELVPMLVAGGSVSAVSEPSSASGHVPASGPVPANEEGCAATVVGSTFTALSRLHASWRLSGSWPDSIQPSLASPPSLPSRPSLDCVVGETLAKCAGLGVGHTARIRVGRQAASELTCRVSGILSTGESEDQEIFVALPALQEVTGSQGRLSLAAFSIDGGVDAVLSAAAAVQAAVPGSEARPLRQVAAAQGAILEKLDRMMFLLTVVVLVLTGLCLATTLTAIVVEREGEIGLMRSIGAGDRQILTMFLGELGLLGLAGSALGFALGAAGARMIGFRLFGTAIEPRLGVAPAVVLLSLGVCLVSMLLPLRRALRVQPAAALRGD